RPEPPGGARRRGAGGATGAHPARGLPRDRRAVPTDARHLRLPRGSSGGARAARGGEGRRRPVLRGFRTPGADVALLAQGRPRRRGRGGSPLGVRGGGPAAARGHPAGRGRRVTDDVSRETPPVPSAARGVFAERLPLAERYVG